ncbi:hypothetical protein HK405_015929, partial [Cladochytrium tenue]
MPDRVRTRTRIAPFPRPSDAAVEACLADLRVALTAAGPGARVTTTGPALRRRAHDLSYHEPHAPHAVVAVASEAHIAAALRVCNQHRVPVVPLAGGTSLEGHTVPSAAGGVVLDCSAMDRVVAVHEDDLDAVVEPGVGWVDLREALEPARLFFPPDPGAAACIGGMCGTNCSGTLAFRYGTMKDNVLALRVVLADGSVLRVRRRAVKSSAGYDLVRLFVGSEGTLGVVTQATLRLRRLPSHSTVALATFSTMDAAARAVHALVLSGAPFNRLELLDAPCVRAVNLHETRPGEVEPFHERPTLLAECAALSEDGLRDQLAALRRVFDDFVERARVEALNPASAAAASAAGADADAGPPTLSIATDHRHAERLWDLRKKALFAAPALRTHPSTLANPTAAPPAVSTMTTDVAVPVSRLAAALAGATRLLERHRLVAPIVAHAGDGNFHCFVLIRDGDAAELARAHALADDLAALALELDGTVSGEHGVGVGKMHLLEH